MNVAVLVSLAVLSAVPKSPAKPPAPAGAVRFIEDDYAKALKTAKAQKKLLFVEAWAPWCHSCMFMREHVLTRPAFTAFEKDVVFAAIDTEKAKNVGFLEAFPVQTWPTLFFIDPATGKLLFKWIGSADEVQMAALLSAAQAHGTPVAEADALLASGDAAAAARRYQAALGSGEASNARAALSLLSALYLAHEYEACTKAGLEHLPTFTAAGDRVNAIGWGLGCALELPASSERTRMVDQYVAEGMKALTLPDVLADDVSGLYHVLVMERQNVLDTESAEKLAAQWLTYLEQEAAKATTPRARAVFDAHRLTAAMISRQCERVIGPLSQSEKDLPKDYNPPARLAIAYRELERFDEALAAADRALKKSTGGPRKLRIYETKASILEQKGDSAGRKKVLAEALAYAKKLPKAQVSAARIAALEAQVK